MSSSREPRNKWDEFWLIQNKKHKIQLPVNPENLEAFRERSVNNTELASGNEVMVLGGHKLRTYSIESFFPGRKPYYSQVKDMKKPSEYNQILLDWYKNKTPLQLKVTGTRINIEVIITKYTWKYGEGYIGDIDYTIELTENRRPSYTVVKRKKTSKGSKSTATSSRSKSSKSKSKSKKYTVVKGDSLSKIAKKYYHDSSKWPKIYEANKKVIGKNPNKIYPGQKLVIP